MKCVLGTHANRRTRRAGSRSETKNQALADDETTGQWIDAAPRVRVRTAADKARLQLADLAVLNERLAKLDSTNAADREEVIKARKRVEFMKRSRKTWAMVYDYLMDNDVDCTVDAIEEANAKVMSMLEDDAVSVAEQRSSLDTLRQQTDDASFKLRRTEAEIESFGQRDPLLRTARILLAHGLAGGGQRPKDS